MQGHIPCLRSSDWLHKDFPTDHFRTEFQTTMLRFLGAAGALVTSLEIVDVARQEVLGLVFYDVMMTE